MLTIITHLAKRVDGLRAWHISQSTNCASLQFCTLATTRRAAIDAVRAINQGDRK
jgi:hypothetical protein